MEQETRPHRMESVALAPNRCRGMWSGAELQFEDRPRVRRPVTRYFEEMGEVGFESVTWKQVTWKQETLEERKKLGTNA